MSTKPRIFSIMWARNLIIALSICNWMSITVFIIRACITCIVSLFYARNWWMMLLGFGNTRCLREWHWWRNARKSYSKLLLLLLDRVNEVWCQLQYHHQIRANFVTYRTSTNNGDGDGDSNADSDSDSDGSNEGNGAKKKSTQDEPGMLVNHGIITT